MWTACLPLGVNGMLHVDVNGCSAIGIMIFRLKEELNHNDFLLKRKGLKLRLRLLNERGNFSGDGDRRAQARKKDHDQERGMKAPRLVSERPAGEQRPNGNSVIFIARFQQLPSSSGSPFEQIFRWTAILLVQYIRSRRNTKNHDSHTNALFLRRGQADPPCID